MSLAQVQYPPPTPQGMEEWFHAHVRHHEALMDAIFQTRGVRLTMYPIYPVLESKNLDVWHKSHQALHDQMNQLLKVAGTDLEDIDFKDQRKSDNWFFQHYLQHQGAAQECGLPV